ncbi:leader peptidase [Geomicrobium sp. JCM 19037]|uniref:prepilin peptidase n=1 Tax=unclassified Geomicrobium TaxID=2628951 RepID=UPI00045F39D9|nr:MULTISPECIES: A24 family peptidase [unclassified Geomicrobium]GAK05930.1 leader peptidase [Geomicrobium sp. JCM 19037]GAK12290.1 leader peptidase [Geomicrobium sp. JCM 19039]
MDIAFIYLPLFIVLIVSVYTDLKYRLIYDKWTLPSMVYFLVANAILDFSNVHMYVLGGILLGGIHLLLAIVSRGQVGGGDIKLFTVIGLALGLKAGMGVVFATYLIAGLWAIPYLIYQSFILKNKEVTMIPLAPFIAAGTACYLAILLWV